MSVSVCCFSGYRPEKMPPDLFEGSPDFSDMLHRLRNAVCNMEKNGCRHFLSGMSRGFDLWAAETVLELKNNGHDIYLWAAVAFPGMQQYWEPEWQKRYEHVLSHADRIFPVSPKYAPDCYMARDRFLVQHSSQCICFFDGTPGGTEYTVNLARRSGLTVHNLADMQLSFDSIF